MILGGAGCSSRSVEPFPSSAGAQLGPAELEAVGAAKWCGGGAVAKVGGARLEYLDQTIQFYGCVREPDGLEIVAVDRSTGQRVDASALARADYQQMKSAHDGLDTGLEAALDGAGGPAAEEVRATLARTGLIDVDVWMVADFLPDSVESFDARPDPRARWTGQGDAVVSSAEALLRDTAELAESDAWEVVTVLEDRRRFPVPVLHLRVSPSLARKIGRLPGVWRVMIADEVVGRHYAPASENYMTLTQASVADALGWDGTGINVGNHEGALPWSIYNLSVPSGPCSAVPGTYRCTDPLGAPNDHVHAAVSTIRNTVTAYGGVADEVQAHWCNGSWQQLHDLCLSTWGVTVMNRSVARRHDPNPAQDSTELYQDYVAMYWSLLYTGSAGNAGIYNVPGQRLRNGLVVGGSGDNATLASLAMFGGSMSCNPGSTPSGSSCNNTSVDTTWELPHVVAKAVSVTTAHPRVLGWQTSWGGTSAAAPQVAGLVAVAQEVNPSLKTEPAAVFAGVMAGASGSADTSLGGAARLNLHDGWDDFDGAGMVRYLNSLFILSPTSKRNGGQAAAQYGHDYDWVFAGSTPAGSYYQETWNVSIPAGSTLRATALAMSTATCTTGDASTCTSNTYPWIWFELKNGSTLLSASFAPMQNYQYLTFTNSSGSAVDRTLRAYVIDWNGSAWTRLGVAWYTTTE